jgi:2-keto-4-pentenoate hydratase/2-oxohepta-3-ene-1,7-dioic acid hydratase in catechol pathway
LPWERAKAFDGSAVLSQFVTLEGDISELSLRLSINGEVKQMGGVEDMLHSPEVLLREAQSFLTFEENDILMTGTPAGVGLVNREDVFLGQIFQGDKLLLEQKWVVS